ncbi:MAG: diguanylate cyclase [Actinobacteria bacterium]|nr:diguanylate cyclase [Actinomycetota bacterium]
MDGKISSLDVMAKEYSAWDDTYNFINDGNKNYINSNLVEGTYTNLKINLFAILDKQENIKYIGLYDLNENKYVEVSEHFKDSLLNSGKLVQQGNEKSDVAGIALIDGKPAFIAAQPVIKSDDSGPVDGTLIMGQYLDNSTSDLLSSVVGYPVQLYNISENTNQEKFAEILSKLKSGSAENKNIQIEYLSSDKISGYYVINDISGVPVQLLQILLPRTIYQQGRQSTNEFILMLIFSGLISCLTIFLVLKKIVLSRITNLSLETIKIGKSNDLSGNIPFKGNDEISKLTGNINGMLDNIKNYQDEIKHLSFYDYLTGIYNRAFFEKELQKLDKQKQFPLSLVIGDVNGLKILNDAFGHEKGDELLIKVAKILKESFRSKDIVSRWGGDEFIIILPMTCLEDTTKIINRVSKKFKRESTKMLPLSISFGMEVKNDITQDIADVIKNAEDKMYKHKLIEQQSIHSSIIFSLEKTLEERDYETKEHIERMKSLAVKLGNALKLTEEENDELTLLAALHDIGKISIADDIILKPEKLDKGEWEIIKKHPEIGFRIAETSTELASISRGILYHHEWWNGKGYPKGLSGEKIPLISRIISIIDAYDAMTNDRLYRKALSKEEAIKELKRCSGSQFDPELVKNFIKVIEKN